MKLQLTRTEK